MLAHGLHEDVRWFCRTAGEESHGLHELYRLVGYCKLPAGAQNQPVARNLVAAIVVYPASSKELGRQQLCLLLIAGRGVARVDPAPAVQRVLHPKD